MLSSLTNVIYEHSTIRESTVILNQKVFPIRDFREEEQICNYMIHLSGTIYFSACRQILKSKCIA